MQSPRQPREMEYRQAANFMSLYSNNIQLRLMPWDIQLTFGEILSADAAKMVVENRLAVNLSPQTAKSLLKVLAGIVQRYEDEIGEIHYGEIRVEEHAE
jgi:methyl coenzyme M reductase alpha subunit